MDGEELDEVVLMARSRIIVAAVGICVIAAGIILFRETRRSAEFVDRIPMALHCHLWALGDNSSEIDCDLPLSCIDEIVKFTRKGIECGGYKWRIAAAVEVQWVDGTFSYLEIGTEGGFTIDYRHYCTSGTAIDRILGYLSNATKHKNGSAATDKSGR